MNFKTIKSQANKQFFCLSLLILVLISNSIRAQEGAIHKETEEHSDHEERAVSLSAEEMKEFGIVLDTAGAGTIRNYIVVPGVVSVNQDRLAHIVPRFEGVVKEVRKNIGDIVHKGEVLAIVESNEGLTPFEVKSLLDGVIIDKHLTVGEVHSLETPAFSVADLDTVWINLSLYQMHLPLVKLGQHTVVRDDLGINEEAGLISYISPVIDEHTRTATARVVLRNLSGKWRPGLFVEGRIETYKESVLLAVPKTSIFQMDGTDVVFVLTEHGFEPREIKVGSTDERVVEITAGIVSGDIYASQGGLTIKAEIEKASFGDGHSH